MRAAANAVTFDSLGFGYRAGTWVLRNYSASIAKGRIFAILGPNGRGKTTLLQLLLKALTPREGAIAIEGTPAFVPQLFTVSFPYRVLDMVLMGRARQIGLFSLPSPRDHEAAWNALERLGLADLAERNFDELSGGQRQLVIFARALASGADVLILDEPTSALDMKNQATVLKWIHDLSRNLGLTVIFSTHHPHHAHAVADDALLMLGEREYSCGPVRETLTEENLQRLYEVPLRRVSFEHRGESVSTFVPVYEGLESR
ncbi:MAG: ABC transporter ATP-binding protein [Gammaproteobacteria bacterium]